MKESWSARRIVNQWRALISRRKLAATPPIVACRSRTVTLDVAELARLDTPPSPMIWYPWGASPFAYRRTATLPSQSAVALLNAASARRHMLVRTYVHAHVLTSLLYTLCRLLALRV
jgi:hypothetical protein